jgi:hypothetical protein
MRAPFTDRWNSIAHLFLGLVSPFFWPLIPVFVLYQYQFGQERNRYIDLLEFFIGWSITVAAMETRSFGQSRDSYGLVYG